MQISSVNPIDSTLMAEHRPQKPWCYSCKCCYQILKSCIALIDINAFCSDKFVYEQFQEKKIRIKLD